ncbi:MAG: maleylpyruvate isomerase N-terminal domain-containing protein [Nitriliruptorales bacterium]
MSPSNGATLVEVGTAIESVAGRVARVIRSASDLSRAVPRLEWTAAETAAHLVAVCRVYTEAITGYEEKWMAPYLSGPDSAPARVAEGNARTLAQMTDHDAASLSRQLDEAVRAFLGALAGRSGSTSVKTPWWGEGHSRDLASLAAIALGEFVVHGYDIARALGQSWAIDPAHARLVLDSAMWEIPHHVNPETARDVDASYMIHVRGGRRFVIHFDQGSATMHTSREPVDCHLWVDPVAFLLVGYGRIGQWGPIAKGKLVAWGRKPWLGVKFKSLLLDP